MTLRSDGLGDDGRVAERRFVDHRQDKRQQDERQQDERRGLVMKRLGRLARSQRGIAIIIVLLITTMLTVLILDLHQSVRINFYIATNLIDGVKASYLVRSGIDVGAGVCLRDIQNNNGVDYWGQDWYDFLGKAGIPAIPISDSESLIMDINDESGRFNLNNLIDKKGRPVRTAVEVFAQLLNNYGLDPTLANAVVDYISTGTETYAGSGDKDSVYGYSSMTPPATAKCTRFELMQEVRLVAGITDDVWAALAAGDDLWRSVDEPEHDQRQRPASRDSGDRAQRRPFAGQ